MFVRLDQPIKSYSAAGRVKVLCEDGSVVGGRYCGKANMVRNAVIVHVDGQPRNSTFSWAKGRAGICAYDLYSATFDRIGIPRDFVGVTFRFELEFAPEGAVLEYREEEVGHTVVLQGTNVDGLVLFSTATVIATDEVEDVLLLHQGAQKYFSKMTGEECTNAALRWHIVGYV